MATATAPGDAFVAAAAQSDAGADDLSVVDELPGGLLLVELKNRPASARDGWQQVLERLPSAHWVAPVLADEQGLPKLPTGDLSIRFRDRRDDEALRRFAAEHGLTLERRNEFVPEQAVFAPKQPRTTYLPQLVEELAAAPDVASVWPNTLSRYRRA